MVWDYEKLNLSKRSKRCLVNSNTLTFEEITSKSAKDLMRVYGVGDKTIVEIREALQVFGLDLQDDA